MKGFQKGFISYFLITFFAILAISGAVYFKINQEQEKFSNPKLETGLKVNVENEFTPPVSIMKDQNIEIINEIKNKNFELLQAPREINFGEALDIANYVSNLVKIRPAFLLAILQEELSLEKFDMCYLTDIKTGDGIRITDNAIKPKTMHPTRDIPPFLKIMKELGRDPLNTPITCPMSFGYGGAMGPADFIPSTWVLYEKKIENITKKSADPWDINDAFLAAGLFLSDVGAKSKTYSGEWKAAMIYFSGSANSPHHFYADGAMKIAEEIQQDIEKIENK